MKLIQFFKSLGYLLFLNGLIKPVWIFGVDRQVQNVVGHETYGHYFALLSLTLVLSFFADAGLTQMVNRQVAAGQQYGAAQLLRAKMLLLGGYLLLVAFFAAVAGINDWHLLALVACVQALTSFFVFLRHLVTAHQLFATDALLSVIDKVLMVALFLPLLYTSLFAFEITIPLFLYLQIGCTVIAISVALYIIIKKGILQQHDGVKTPAITVRSVLPFAAIILLMSAHNRLDGFLLHRLHADGAYQAGLYAAAYRLLDAGNMIGYLTASFLVPFMAKHLAQKNLIEATVLSSRLVLLLAGGVATVFVVVFAKEVQTLLYPALPIEGVPVLQTCMAVLPAYLLLHVYGSLLTAAAQLKSFISILTVTFFINLLLNLWLIPIYGAWGSCVAALVSQYAAAFSCYLVAAFVCFCNYGDSGDGCFGHSRSAKSFKSLLGSAVVRCRCSVAAIGVYSRF
jgi:O-antigen/teichoic acid export membrane protein